MTRRAFTTMLKPQQRGAKKTQRSRRNIKFSSSGTGISRQSGRSQ
jgi:hypothetical protein